MAFSFRSLFKKEENEDAADSQSESTRIGVAPGLSSTRGVGPSGPLTVGELLDFLPSKFIKHGSLPESYAITIPLEDLKAMAHSGGKIQVTRVQAWCPELFLRPIQAEEDHDIALPIARINSILNENQSADLSNTRPSGSPESDSANTMSPFSSSPNSPFQDDEQPKDSPFAPVSESPFGKPNDKSGTPPTPQGQGGSPFGSPQGSPFGTSQQGESESPFGTSAGASPFGVPSPPSQGDSPFGTPTSGGSPFAPAGGTEEKETPSPFGTPGTPGGNTDSPFGAPSAQADAPFANQQEKPSGDSPFASPFSSPGSTEDSPFSTVESNKGGATPPPPPVSGASPFAPVQSAPEMPPSVDSEETRAESPFGAPSDASTPFPFSAPPEQGAQEVQSQADSPFASPKAAEAEPKSQSAAPIASPFASPQSSADSTFAPPTQDPSPKAEESSAFAPPQHNQDSPFAPPQKSEPAQEADSPFAPPKPDDAAPEASKVDSPFAAPSASPFAAPTSQESPKPEQADPPFAAPSASPFAPTSQESPKPEQADSPFAAPADSPFAAPKPQEAPKSEQADSPFAAPPKPQEAPKSEQADSPFAAPADSPFAAPKPQEAPKSEQADSPFAAPADSPFAAPTPKEAPKSEQADSPFAAPADSPFAAPIPKEAPKSEQADSPFAAPADSPFAAPMANQAESPFAPQKKEDATPFAFPSQPEEKPVADSPFAPPSKPAEPEQKATEEPPPHPSEKPVSQLKGDIHIALASIVGAASNKALGMVADQVGGAKATFPISLIEPQLSTGKVRVTGEELKNAAGDAKALLVSIDPNAQILLPLQEVLNALPANAFENRSQAPKKADAPKETIETPFSRLSENDPANEPQAQDTPKKKTKKKKEANLVDARPMKAEETANRFPMVPPKPKPKTETKSDRLNGAQASAPAPQPKRREPRPMEALGGMFDLGANLKQLELRAIFNTDAVLDVPEIVDLTGRMDNVVGCILMHQDGDDCRSQSVDSAEVDAFFREAPGFHANMRKMTQDLGIGNAESFSVNTEKGMISFFSKDKICLGVLHDSCTITPGTRERLILVTRELAKMMA